MKALVFFLFLALIPALSDRAPIERQPCPSALSGTADASAADHDVDRATAQAVGPTWRCARPS
jgi:hypothetical protein